MASLTSRHASQLTFRGGMWFSWLWIGWPFARLTIRSSELEIEGLLISPIRVPRQAVVVIERRRSILGFGVWPELRIHDRDGLLRKVTLFFWRPSRVLDALRRLGWPVEA